MENAKTIKSAINKITWPSFKTTMKNTGYVLGFSLIVGAITLASDFVGGTLLQLILP